MIFSSFYDEFPDLIRTEVRCVEFSNNSADSKSLIPDGHYEFFEYYCTDINCDCKKVIINVISYDPNKSWVSIHYGWGSDKYMSGFQLDPRSTNNPISKEFLELYKEMIRRDKRYAARIEKHYSQFKERMREQNTTNAIQNPICNVPGKKIGRNDPCHCNSGKKFKKCCLLMDDLL